MKRSFLNDFTRHFTLNLNMFNPDQFSGKNCKRKPGEYHRLLYADPSGRMQQNYGGPCLTHMFTHEPVAH